VEAGRALGGPPDQVVLTHPADWAGQRRGLLAEAAGRAGLGRPELLPEPVAAAVHFTGALGQQVRPGATVVVYDFGAGTFDVSILRRQHDDRWEVVSAAGLDDCGGADLDAALVEHIGATVGFREPDVWDSLRAPVSLADRRNRRTLWEDSREAKEQLARSSSVTVPVPLVGQDVLVTREEFEQLARPWLDRTIALTTSTLFAGNVGAGTLAGVYLVGGSSRIPLVSTLLHRALGVAPVAIEQPELVVALGSVRALGVGQQPAPTRPPVTPRPAPQEPAPPRPAPPEPAPPEPAAPEPATRKPRSRATIPLLLLVAAVFVVLLGAASGTGIAPTVLLAAALFVGAVVVFDLSGRTRRRKFRPPRNR
jgi:molecular chaperone DnaK (HSP70)